MHTIQKKIVVSYNYVTISVQAFILSNCWIKAKKTSRQRELNQILSSESKCSNVNKQAYNWNSETDSTDLHRAGLVVSHLF